MKTFTKCLAIITFLLLVFPASALCRQSADVKTIVNQPSLYSQAGTVDSLQQFVEIKAIDVSESMRKNNMFQSAKEALIDNIKEIPAGTEVIIIKFGLTADEVVDRKIITEQDRDDIIERVSWLSPTEDWTQFDELIKEIKLLCYQLRSRYNDNVIMTITVLSDGISSPDKALGKKNYNLESVVSQTFPQANGFSIYLVSLKEAETKDQLNTNFRNTANKSVISVVTPPENIGRALTRIDSIEEKKNNSTNSSFGNGPKKSEGDSYGFIIPAIIFLILIAAVIAAYILNRRKKEIESLTKELDKSDQIAQGKVKLLTTKLRITESSIDNDGNIINTTGEHFIKFYPNYNFSIGKDAESCSIILNSDKAPLVLCMVTVCESGNETQITNESGKGLKINDQFVKDGHSQSFPVDNKITITDTEHILVILEKILIRDNKESEKDFLANLSKEAPVNEEEVTEQQL